MPDAGGLGGFCHHLAARAESTSGYICWNVAEPSIVRNLPAICAFSRYELLGRLAVGGMAEIYLAREPEMVQGAGHRTLVIKRVLPHVADDPAFVEMFFNEARLAMRLRHPAIVHIYEFGEEQGSYFLAMEWVDGVPLGKIIRRARKSNGVPAELAVKIAATTAEALDYAHRARGDDGEPLGIVHRDVSPQNIMISYDGAVKLLDFGIAKADDESLTKDGQVKGKFAYMSPQQCLGEAIDGRADVFALGVCLHESLTGRPLYHRKTQYETMRAVIEDAVPSILEFRPELPESLDAVVRKALAKDPADRYQSAGEMQIALERWLMEQGEVVPQTRLADFLEELFEDEVGRGPMVDSKPFGASFADIPVPAEIREKAKLAQREASQRISLTPRIIDVAPLEAPTSRQSSLPPAPPKSKMPLVAALIVLLFLGAGVGGFLWWKSQGAPPQQVAANVPAAANAAPPTAPTETAPTEAPAPTEVLPAVEPETLGSLRVSTEPPGATVVLDGDELPGTTPLMAGDLQPGTYSIVVTLDGRETYASDVTVVAGEQASVEPRLREVGASRRGRRRAGVSPMEQATMAAAPAGRGTLSVNTRPWSKVYVGGELLGTTPIGRAVVNAGSVRVRLVDRDGNEHQRTVNVDPDEDARVFWDLR